MEDKTCFNCKHLLLCYVKKDVIDATSGYTFLNIDNPDHSGQWADIFKALAGCCLLYELPKK